MTCTRSPDGCAPYGWAAAEVGWSLVWDGLDRDRNRAAARAAYDGDPAPLRTVLDERLRRSG